LQPPFPLERARQYQAAGQADLALELYQAWLEYDPQEPQIWWGLALLAWQQGEGTRAESYFLKALEYSQQSLPLPQNQEFSLFSHAFQEVILAFVLALIAAWQSSPKRAQAHQLALHLCTYPATHALQACILGSLLHALGELALALQWCRHSLDLKPSAQAWFVLAQLRFSLGDRALGTEACRQALALDAQHSDARTLLAHALMENNEPQAALAEYEQVLAQKPEFAALHFHVGRMYQSLGQLNQAQKHYQQALQLQPEQPLWQLQARLVYAPLSESSQARKESLQIIEAALAQDPKPIDLSALQSQLTQTNLDTLFDLHYLSENPLALKQRFSRYFQGTTQPIFKQNTGRIKLAIVVTPQHEGIFAFSSGQLFARLDPHQFELNLLIWPSSEAIFKQILPELPRQVLNNDWARAVAQIHSQNFDLVHYWEVGTDPLNYFLPFFRLGRVQWTSWGSCGSTGHPQIDYFVSARGLEDTNYAHRYSEKVLLMENLPIWYNQSHLQASDLNRAQLGLPEKAVLALCPHNLLKLHTDFDSVLTQICKRSPELKLVFLNSRNPVWNAQFKQRLQQSISAEQMIFLPRLAAPDFLALLHLGDFALDPWPYGAGKLAFEIAGLGLPLLSLTGQTLKGRIPTACYQRLEMTEYLAYSEQDYLEKAARLAQDRNYRNQWKQTLAERHHLLFENQNAVEELALLLKNMAKS
jgi:protein O-GlcNAc transferase